MMHSALIGDKVTQQGLAGVLALGLSPGFITAALSSRAASEWIASSWEAKIPLTLQFGPQARFTRQ
jgi:hypothetical protein